MVLLREPVYQAETTDTDSDMTLRAPWRQHADRGAERRRGLRIRQERPIKLYEPTASRYLGGQTQDNSSTGLRIELPAWAALRTGHVVNVHVGLNQRGESLANRRQMIPARVVWVRTGAAAGRVLAGVEFLSSIAAHLDAA
jgi:hypothetical protein